MGERFVIEFLIQTTNTCLCHVCILSSGILLRISTMSFIPKTLEELKTQISYNYAKKDHNITQKV